MILHQTEYYRWIQRQGVGAKDRVASSPDSYISYLNSVSKLIGRDMSPGVLSSEAGVSNILRQLHGRRAQATIRNYRSAMRQYVAMVKAGVHRLNESQ